MCAAIKEAPALLMPKATAVWLIENTALTFRQIAVFVGLTEIEIEALANEEIGRGLVGRDPVENGELTQEELDRCCEDPHADLKIAKRDLPSAKVRAKGPRYTPVSKRGDKPDAIAYILKHHPDIKDSQIVRLVGTTKPTIQKIRDKSHLNMSAIKPRHPADLGLCSYVEFEKENHKALKAAGKDPEAIAKQQQEEAEAALNRGNDDDNGSDSMSGFDFSNFLGTSN